MMNKKFLTMMFSLLLAVGWTSSASAQQLPGNRTIPKDLVTSRAADQINAHGEAVPMQRSLPTRANAPTRSESDLVASAVRTKTWWNQQDPISWEDLNGVSQSTSLTVPYTDANGMMALLERIYTDKTIPGAKYSAPQGRDIPYQTIQYGWGILGTNYQDLEISVSSAYVLIRQITITNPDGTVRLNITANSSNAPTGWKSVTWDGYYYWQVSSSGDGTLTIDADYYLKNSLGYSDIVVKGICYSSSVSSPKIWIGNDQFGYYSYDAPYSSEYIYSATCEYSLPGTLTPPDYSGYTVLLVKLKDGFNYNYNDENDRAPKYTADKQALREYFTKYVSEIQLLTDGMRVGTGTNNSGTVFAYTGNLNRFFYISKGKMAFLSSLDNIGYDRAPFYSMYEEFAPVSQDNTTGFDDFYIRMLQKESYSVVHDCNSVNYMQHYFSMAGKQGTSANDVSSLVFYIPDYRGGTSDDWRDYVVAHQPKVGMYIIELTAAAEPAANYSTANRRYSVTVNWTSNLNDITNNTVPQTYKLYEIADWNNDGKMDTTCIYTGPNTYYTYPDGVPQYQSAYPITYYVIGTPDAASNKDIFFDKSNDGTVIIPGYDDFIGLDRMGYESDYVISEEKNYYRNHLSPRSLFTVGGITPNSIGNGIRTIELYRYHDNEKTRVAYLDLIMLEGNKACYRIRYENQYPEPGYTAPTNNSNN